MTGDLSEPAHGAAQQASEAAARLYEQAAAELDQAAAHCRVAATHFRGAEVPRGAAHAWAALGHLREAELRLEEQARTTASRRASRACVEDHLRPVTGGTDASRCRRLGSPQSSREVPAETQEEPAGTGRGTGHSGRIGVRGPEAWGVAGNRGSPVWPLEVPVRGAVAHRLRPVGISAQARSVTAGAGLAFPVPARASAGPPRMNQQPLRAVYSSRARPLRSSLRDHDGGAAVRSGSSRAKASSWPAGLC
jgi:hypothetical protein